MCTVLGHVFADAQSDPPPSRQPLGAASKPVPSYHRPWLRVDAAFDAAGYEGSAQLVTMPDTPIDVSDNGVAEPTPAAPKPVARVPLYVAKHPTMKRPQSAGTATISMPMKDRKVPDLKAVSDGTLAGSVLELAQTLTKNNAILRERSEEKARLSQILAEFKKHLQWQNQRKLQLKRNLERLHNETKWLNDKASEVKQDTTVISNELRQATSELDKLKAVRDARKLEVATLDQELKLEQDSAKAVGRKRSPALQPSPC